MVEQEQSFPRDQIDSAGKGRNANVSGNLAKIL
jgi:hypothetical protein